LKKPNFILLIILFSFTQLFAQKIELKLVFNDTIIKPTKIITYNKFINQIELKTELSAIINQLNSQAYLTSTIDSIVIDTTFYKAYLHLGKQYKWTYLTTTNIDEEVLSKIGFRDKLFMNRPFNNRQLYSFYEKIITHYENNGFPFASLKIDSLGIFNNMISANLNLSKNKFCLVDSVKIVGTATISDRYIQNYIRIKDGDYYNETIIKNISNRIKELPFVEEQQPFKVTFTENKNELLLNLKKKKASRFNGILGVQTDNNTGEIRFTGDVKLNLVNSFKKGEEIDFNWRSIQKNTQDLKAKFSYPFLFNTPFGLDYNFKLYKKDTTFIDVFNKIGVRYILKGNNYMSVFFQNKSSSLLSTSGFGTLTVLPNFADISTQLYGINFYYSKLDYRLNPRKGYEIDTEGAIGSKNIKKNNALNESLYDDIKLKSNLYNLNLNASIYFPIKNRSVIKLGTQNGLTYNDNLFENELLRIGGLFTLRGFDEESIYTSAFTVQTIEYRFILEQNSYLYLFADGAYYENRKINSNISDRPFGFGAGMSFETKAGIFSISYALGKQFDNPILFKNAKVHFGFVNYF
jgi:outer membrane protein assembly factor BamA